MGGAIRTNMQIKYIVLHCSDSSYGDSVLIDEWHENRGFERRYAFSNGQPLKHIGYHYVILNGRRTPLGEYKPIEDGMLEKGRFEGETGAHAFGVNSQSIGICLVGRKSFTARQFDMLEVLCKRIIKDQCLSEACIIGHRDTPYEQSQAEPKTCPNFDVYKWVSKVRWR